jgi:hypothetical protein
MSWAFVYFISGINFVNYNIKEFCTMISWLLFIGINVASIITHFVVYTNQCKDLEKLNQIKSDKRIFKERANLFLGQIRNLLVEVYPLHEKEIFTKITTQTASTIFSVYPDIKSNDTIMHYVKQLIEFDDKAYQCDLAMNDTIKDIKVRKRVSKLWMYSGFIPIAPTPKDYQKFYE